MKKILTLISFVFLFACSNTKTVSDVGNYHFIKGLNYYQKNQKDKALNEFLLAEKEQPTNPMILREIAYFYLDIGDFGKAKQYYEKSIEIEPHDVTALKNLVYIYLNEADTERVDYYLSKFIDKNSDDYLFSHLNVAIFKNDRGQISSTLNKLIFKENFYKANLSEKIFNILEENYSKRDLLKIYEKFYHFNSKNENVIARYSKVLYDNDRKAKCIEILLLGIAETDSENLLDMAMDFYKKENNISEYNKLKKLKKY